MRNPSIKTKFLETLPDLPFINYAAKKVGISRATVYRWMEKDPKFKSKVLKAQETGQKLFTEAAEFVLMKKIKKDEDLSAVKYYLSRIDPRYYPKRPFDTQQEERTMEYDKLMFQAWAEMASNVLGKSKADKN